MASKKSKILAIAFCAAVMSGIYAPNVTYALPEAGYRGGYYPKDEQNVVYDNDQTTSESGIVINDPNIKHPAVGNHTDQCGEKLYDTDMTLGEFNQVVDDLVETDNNIANKVDEVSDTVDKINDAYENGELKGEKGDKGDQGIQGEKGEKGDKGDQGIQGEKGEKGDKGDQGIQGEKGEKGDKGDQGIQGEKGDKGDKGDQGIQGEKGDKGDKGDTGAKGDSIASGSYDVKDGKVEMPIKNDKGETVGNVTINDVASQTEVKQAQQTAEDAATLAGDALSTAKEVEIDLEQEAADREKADADLQADINAKEEQSKDRDAQLQADIDAEEQARKDADADLQADINAKEEQSKYRDAQLQQSIDIQREVIGAGSTDELKGAYSGTNYIKDANNMAEADVILDREISNVNSRVDGIENRVDGLEDRIDKVGAMAAAIANLRTMGYDPAAPTEVAVGVGQYRDETGMALGLFHYPNRDFMLSLSVSTSGDEYMGGIGATWKFGRKSPEKVAEIKKAQAEADARRAEEQKLAKAEEMKKAAKEAKVQAQMERHAKLAAERAALEEA